MNRLTPFVFTLLSAFCSGCSSLMYFDLPIYQICESPFPAMGSKIILVNNAAEQPVGAGSYLVNVNHKEQRLLFDRDSLNFPMLDMLGQQMLESEFIEDVAIYTHPFRTDSLYRSASRLTAEQLQGVASESDASWILSLDAMPHHLEIQENLLADFNLVNAKLEIRVSPVFRLYKVGETEPIKQYYVSDTLRQEATQLDLRTAIAALPPLNQSLEEALYLTAEKALHRWLPYRVTEHRCWVNHPHSVMREGASFFIKGDTESAAYMWEYGYENIKNNKVRYYAAYNRGVLAELNGDLEIALQWLDKAKLVKPTDQNVFMLKIDEIYSSIQNQLKTQHTLLPLL